MRQQNAALRQILMGPSDPVFEAQADALMAQLEMEVRIEMELEAQFLPAIPTGIPGQNQ